MKKFLLVCLISLLVLGVSSIASADTTTWKIVPNGVDQAWNNSLNWSTHVPINDGISSVTLYASTTQANGPVITVASQGEQIRCGGAGGPGGTTAHMTVMPGGSLTVGNFLLVAPDSTTGGGRNGTLHMWGGEINLLALQGRLGIGNGLDSNKTGSQNITGTLDMTAGTINALAMVIGANYTKGIAIMSGGTINTNAFDMRPDALNPNNPSLTMSATAKIIVNGDISAKVLGYQGNGWINDEVQIDYNITNPGKTTLMIPEPATLCLLGIGALSLLRRRS